MEEASVENLDEGITTDPSPAGPSLRWRMIMLGGYPKQHAMATPAVRSHLSEGGTVVGVAMPKPAIFPTAVICGNYIVVVGGYHTNLDEDRLDIDMFDTYTDEWMHLPRALCAPELGPEAGGRALCRAVSVPPTHGVDPATNSVVIVTGGCFNSDGSDHSIADRRSCFVFDPVQLRVRRIADMRIARSCHALVRFEGTLVAIGGHADCNECSAEQYDPATDTWNVFPSPPAGCMLFDICAAVMEVNGRDAIYAASSNCVCMFVDHVWARIDVAPLGGFGRFFALRGVLVGYRPVGAEGNGYLAVMDSDTLEWRQCADAYDQWCHGTALVPIVM